MVKGFHFSCFIACTVCGVLVTTPVCAAVWLNHIDATNQQIQAFLKNSVTGNINRLNELTGKYQVTLSNGAAGYLEDIKTSVTDYAGDVADTVKANVGWTENGTLKNLYNDAADMASSAKDSVQSGLKAVGDGYSSATGYVADNVDAAKLSIATSVASGVGGTQQYLNERLSIQNDDSWTSQAADYLSAIPGAGFVSGLLGDEERISGVIGQWGTAGTDKVSLTASSGVDTSTPKAVEEALTFSTEGADITQIHDARRRFATVARDISSSVIATSASNIQNVTDYDKIVAPEGAKNGTVGVQSSLKKAISGGGDTIMEIAQDSQNLRDDLKNFSGTTATLLTLTNVSLSMDVERIALEAGTTLQDATAAMAPEKNNNVDMNAMRQVLGM